MSLIVVGLNHRTVPVDLLEQMTVPPEQHRKALHDLAGREHLLETALLSTCNRTEVYARCTKFHGAVGDVLDFLAEQSGADPDGFADHLYTYYEDAAVSHLFSVAGGLDSMIVGESEILGQVGDAWRSATREGAAGPFVGRAFRHAIEAGKRVRTETEISRHPVSISSAAVVVAEERFAGLAGARVVMLGAGAMGSGIARALTARGVAEICVANRGSTRGGSLATEVGGRCVGLDTFADELAAADVLFGSTASTEVLVTRDLVEAAMARRAGRPLLVVDVALPRDIDPGVAEIPGVTVLDLDDLKDFASRSAARRRQEIGRVRAILDEEIERYRDEQRAREHAPLITALHARGEALRLAELDRFRSRLAGLDDVTLETVDALTRGIVAKLLHDPTVRLKDAARGDRGEILAEALGDLFDLPDPEG